MANQKIPNPPSFKVRLKDVLKRGTYLGYMYIGVNDCQDFFRPMDIYDYFGTLYGSIPALDGLFCYLLCEDLDLEEELEDDSTAFYQYETWQIH